MAHVSEAKKQTVKEFVDMIDTYDVIGVVNMANLPARQLQVMRAKLRNNDTHLKMTKKRLMKIAFSKAKKKDIGELEKHFKGMPALIFTNENPFKLYADLQKTKSKAPAKAGQEAPKDIVVQAGPTNFSPGPIIGQLGKFGIKTGVEGGKLAIKQDTVVVREGETISAELAGILTRLGIEPMEIGLDLRVAYEKGSLFEASTLHIDEDVYRSKFATSYNDSLSLAMHIGYATEETAPLMLSKAYNEARSLALSQGILADGILPDLLSKANNEMYSLSNTLPDEALSDELRTGKSAAPVQETEEPKEDTPQEQEEEESEEDTAAGLGSLFG